MNDKLRQAFLKMVSLRKNLQKFEGEGYVPENYVVEYHSVLQPFEEDGKDVGSFKIPSNSINPVRVASNYLTGEETYASGRFVEFPYFMTQLDAAIAFLGEDFEKPPKKIGF